MSDAKTRTEDHCSLQRAVQGHSRAIEPVAGVAVQDVAASLYIHPFMLSRWRKQAREGLIMTKGVQVDKDVAAELKELRKLKKAHERLKLEHEILKKAIEFASSRRAASLRELCRKGDRRRRFTQH